MKDKLKCAYCEHEWEVEDLVQIANAKKVIYRGDKIKVQVVCPKCDKFVLAEIDRNRINL